MAVFLTVQPPNRLTAQVGHDPASSTYRDVLLHSGPMLFVGELSGDRGRAGAGVSNAFTIGARYEIPAGRSMLSLPMSPNLSGGEIESVCAAVTEQVSAHAAY